MAVQVRQSKQSWREPEARESSELAGGIDTSPQIIAGKNVATRCPHQPILMTSPIGSAKIASMKTLAFMLLIVPAVASAADSVDYARQVKPLLAHRCFACHGSLKQEAGLRLDTSAAMRQGGDSGPAVVAGKGADSVLIQRISEKDVDLRMPPEGEGAPLKPEEIAIIRAWIDAGAPGPADEKPEADPREHWAFHAPVAHDPPKVKNSGWVANPIDAFLAADHEKHGLAPQDPADKRTLLRRVYLDLIGLPPTQAELEAFATDDSLGAYDRVVDKLLASPQYGERWGRHWMDVWRYSDWWGLGAEVRNSAKHVWHWRDWIIESVNHDVGYDEMVRQMLAADELYPNDLARLRATGYLVRNYFKFNRNTWLEGTVEHTSKAFLGLTINCARCHDHKYDPIAQQDYYRLRAFFEPHQIRTDLVPGEGDYEKDGIPRAFDCHLEAPTYRFVRGDEKNPVTSEPISPGVPPVLAFGDVEIKPVSLPIESHQPGLRPWVLQNHLHFAEAQLKAARDGLEQARKNLAAAEAELKKAPPPSTTPQANETDALLAEIEKANAKKPEAAKPEVAKTESVKPEPSKAEAGKALVHDDFAVAKADVWEPVSGQWTHEGGKLLQQDDAARGVLKLKQPAPVDFQVRLQFKITGGQVYKSVGINFDESPTNEMLVYMSAHAPGPKLQAAFKKGSGFQYPAEGRQARSVNVGENQEMLVRVRGTLVNVEVNGQHALAWNSPVPRQSGAFNIITYQAQTEFCRFELSELPASAKLIEPGTSAVANAPVAATPATPVVLPTSPEAKVEEARFSLVLAERTLASAELLEPLARARAAADRAKFEKLPEADVKSLAQEASKLERQSAAAKAAEEAARYALDHFKSPAAKKEVAKKKLAEREELAAKAEAATKEVSDKYIALSGALKAFESPVETDTDRRKPFPQTSTGRRTALAKWLTDRRNPLTARVAINHMWSRHYGKPLVVNVFEFGRKGSPPTHPELLDWLAVELMEHGWSMKHMHRLMVTSSAYKMSSAESATQVAGGKTSAELDSENRYYWRMNPVRMEAQVVRDALLKLAGALDPAMGGPSIPVNTESLRRSVYFVHSHNDHQRFLSMFDDASVQECYRRDQSIVPQQALALSNSKQALEAAAKIAARLPTPENDDDAFFVRAAFLIVLANEPKPDEVAACVEALAAWRKIGAAVQPGEGKARARANLIHALLNHNDFVTIR